MLLKIPNRSIFSFFLSLTIGFADYFGFGLRHVIEMHSKVFSGFPGLKTRHKLTMSGDWWLASYLALRCVLVRILRERNNCKLVVFGGILIPRDFAIEWSQVSLGIAQGITLSIKCPISFNLYFLWKDNFFPYGRKPVGSHPCCTVCYLIQRASQPLTSQDLICSSPYQCLYIYLSIS